LSRLLVSLAAAALFPLAQAQAQTAAPDAKPAIDATKTVKPVTVTARQPAYQRTIDRRSYALGADLQAANGSIADALRNIPSLDVDPQGNLSIRGSGSVTVLVDGQPSALFDGPMRADMLRQLPASRFERVEVMTNPSAAYKPDGTGGVINLITRKVHGPQRTASISGAVGAPARENVALDGTWATSRFTATASAGVRRQRGQSDQQTSRQIVDPASGQSADVDLVGHGRNDWTLWNLGGTAAWDLDPATRLSADLTYFGFRSDGTTTNAYDSSATSGVLAQDYVDQGASPGAGRGLSGATSYRHKLGGDDHQVLARLSYSAFTYRATDTQTFAYALPVQPDLYQDLVSTTVQDTADLKVEYSGPAPGKAKLVAGYELEVDHRTFDHVGALRTDPADAVPASALADTFDFDQAVHALYATYERPIGRFDIQPGLRLEEALTRADDVTGAATADHSYFEVYPTLHTSYRLYDDWRLGASYSRRVQRPAGEELDPFRVTINPLAYSQGNPDLRPQTTDSLEASADWAHGADYVQANLYYRFTHDLVSPVTDTLGGGAILTTYANLGHSRTAGLEVTANAEITRALTLDLTTNLYRDEIEAFDGGTIADRSGTVATGRLKLNWTATPRDFLQLSVYASSRRPTAQGWDLGSSWVDLGYRHKLGERLSLELIVRDPFDTARFGAVVQTPTLDQETRSDPHIRSVSLGFAYALGGAAKPTAKDFDYGAAAPPH
jgi:outer membrane receptor protein involved in Fe transport